MTDSDFEKWFLSNLDTMVSLNIYHWKADRAKEVRAILEILYPELESLNKRLNALEATVSKKKESTVTKKKAQPKTKWLTSGE